MSFSSQPQTLPRSRTLGTLFEERRQRADRRQKREELAFLKAKPARMSCISFFGPAEDSSSCAENISANPSKLPTDEASANPEVPTIRGAETSKKKRRKKKGKGRVQVAEIEGFDACVDQQRAWWERYPLDIRFEGPAPITKQPIRERKVVSPKGPQEFVLGDSDPETEYPETEYSEYAHKTRLLARSEPEAEEEALPTWRTLEGLCREFDGEEGKKDQDLEQFWENDTQAVEPVCVEAQGCEHGSIAPSEKPVKKKKSKKKKRKSKSTAATTASAWSDSDDSAGTSGDERPIGTMTITEVLQEAARTHGVDPLSYIKPRSKEDWSKMFKLIAKLGVHDEL